MKKLSQAIFCFLIAGVWASQALASDLRVMGHRIPPFSMHDDQGGVVGFSAELFRAAFADFDGIGKNHYIIPVTFNRLYVDLQRAKRRVGITIGRNEKREKLFKWVGPYTSVHLGVIAKKDNHFHPETVQDFQGKTIATVEKTAPEQALKKMGVPEGVLQPGLYPLKALQKLTSGRADFMAYPLEGASYLMRQNNIDASDYEEVFRLRKIQLYFAFSQDISDSEIARYQRYLDDFLKTPAFHALKEKYVLDGIHKHIAHD